MKPGDLIRIERSWSPLIFTGILLGSRTHKMGKRYDVHKMLLTDGSVSEVYVDASHDLIDVLLSIPADRS